MSSQILGHISTTNSLIWKHGQEHHIRLLQIRKQDRLHPSLRHDHAPKIDMYVYRQGQTEILPKEN